MSSDANRSDDLLIRARRGELFEGEERRLREALTASRETRCLFDAGCAFDREAPVLPGDDARIEAMVRAVRKRHAQARAPVPRRRVWQTLATGLLFGGAAVAATEGSKSLLWPAAPESTRAAPAPVIASPPAPGPIAQAPRALDAPASATPPIATPPIATPPIATPPIATPPIATPPIAAPPIATPPIARFADVPPPDAHVATAGELFAAANRARVQADSVRAIASYRRLESEFPSSAEALSARLSLGISYLQSGQAGLALEQFRTYEALAHGPTLGEALWGESQALRRLGQRADEQRVLRELLERFPESAYTAAAQKRLSAL